MTDDSHAVILDHLCRLQEDISGLKADMRDLKNMLMTVRSDILRQERIDPRTARITNS